MSAEKIIPFEPSKIQEIISVATELKEMISWQEGSEVEYTCTGGIATGYGLWKEPDVAIQRVHLPADCTFTEHCHDVSEWVLVISGRHNVKIKGANGREKNLKAGDGAYFRPGEVHQWTTIEAGWVIGVTIPAEDGYPDVRRKKRRDSS